MSRLFPLILACGLFSGCKTFVDVGVTNPLPELPRVAIVPFFNQSAERAADGRRFALAYYSELQKVPGFEVLPVGVAENAAIELGLNMSGPEDAVQLAKALDADMVVIGSITDYDPYYPPRLGMSVRWYSPHPPVFAPAGVQVDPLARQHERSCDTGSRLRLSRLGDWWRGSRIRGWISDEDEGTIEIGPHDSQSPHRRSGGGLEGSDASANSDDCIGCTARAQSEDLPVVSVAGERVTGPSFVPLLPAPIESLDHDAPAMLPAPAVPADSSIVPPVLCPPTALYDPTLPVMSYTRLFDGRDAEFLANLRQYLELNTDFRSGGWEEYLSRSEDFIRFTSHLMIKEMLLLHGGEGRRRYIWKW